MTEMANYDKGVAYSPDGRLFQVEYAREAAKRGATAVGIKTADGVVLLVDKRLPSKLVEGSSVEKIFLIDNHIAAASSGLTADARILINSCRSVAQSNKTAFDEPIGVRTLVKNICDYQQIFTQQAGLRPFGVALLIAGVYDNKSYLYETDPSGALFGYKATAIGSGKTVAVETLEQEYKENINLEKAVLLGLKALNKATEGEIDSDTVDVWLVESKTEEFRALERKELESYIKKAQKKEEKGGE